MSVKVTLNKERELVNHAKQGDPDAFEVLVESHQQFVYNLALRTMANEEEARDLSQEAFLRAWRALPRFEGKSSFRTWLYRIVINLCYNRLPKMRRELTQLQIENIEDFPGGDSHEPVPQMEKTETRRILQQEIERLPSSYQALLQLRYRQELSYNDIAKVMELPLGTIKTGLYRARQRLQKAMKQHEEM